jgi:hypothetical protein
MNFVIKLSGLQIRNSGDADYQPLADEIASLSYKSASSLQIRISLLPVSEMQK